MILTSQSCDEFAKTSDETSPANKRKISEVKNTVTLDDSSNGLSSLNHNANVTVHTKGETEIH